MKSIGKFVATNRTVGVSTSDLINRIVANSDEYILRNLIRYSESVLFNDELLYDITEAKIIEILIYQFSKPSI